MKKIPLNRVYLPYSIELININVSFFSDEKIALN